MAAEQGQIQQGGVPVPPVQEAEGSAWARRGIDTQAAAAEYLRDYGRKREAVPAYMRALRRLPSFRSTSAVRRRKSALSSSFPATSLCW